MNPRQLRVNGHSMVATTSASVVRAIYGMAPLQKTAVGGTTLMFAIAFVLQRYYLRIFARSTTKVHTEDETKVTLSLFGNFKQIARIALPTWRCREFLGSVIFIILFAVKAVLRVRLSSANGTVLATMLHGKPSERLMRFVQRILVRSAVALACGVTSGAIEGIRPWLIACYRERLSRIFQRRFYERLVYYQASMLDNRLESADTVIATYCGEFAEHFAELPYYFVLPGFECATSTYALVQKAGGATAVVMGLTVSASVLLLRHLSPQFGRIHALLLCREDDYRRMLGSDLINVESIAMHGAGEYTRRQLDVCLGKLKYTLNHMALAKGHYEMLEAAFTSFLSTAAYVFTFAGSFVRNFHRPIDDIYVEVELIQSLNSSVKDFVVNFRELSHLTEFSTKMAEFDSTLSSIAGGTFIHEGSDKGNNGALARTPVEYTRILSKQPAEMDGVLIWLDNVLLKSPGGHVLFKEMNVKMMNSEDWVIVGENGCGKTSLLRMLTGLWPPTRGHLSLDNHIKFLMAPQHSYMAPQCTLYEQICFPDVPPPVDEKIKSMIKESIELSGAQNVVGVIGGYHSPKMGFCRDEKDESYDWSSLSGGQKQRISMARVFFHVLSMDRTKQTPIAILDEATSMMDDTEQDVINHLRRMNVRMISVTHSEVVIRHHSNILRIRRNGMWHAEPVHNQVPIGERVETSDETV